MRMIGILGGMGPESTAIFYQEIIRKCQIEYGAKYDKDYPEIIIYNLPIPDVVKGIKNPEIVLPILIKGAKKLESIGVDFIVMPCNTAHYFYEDIKKRISIPILSIIEETAKKIIHKRLRRVGLLATATTINKKIFNEEFDKYGIDLIIPQGQKRITRIILNILAGKRLKKDRRELIRIIKELEDVGAEAIVLGCTDIPILLRKEDVDIEIIDTVELYAESTVRYAVSN